jgi:transcription antitermination factor NusG
MIDLPPLAEHLKAMAAQATERAKATPIDANIWPDGRSLWHVVVTHPQCENIAAAHLAGRRFGVYLPTGYEEKFIRGCKRVVNRPLFPGYLFLFVQRIDRNWHKIEGCAGVAHIMVRDAGAIDAGDRFLVPVVVTDNVMDHIQALEANEITKNIKTEPPKSRKQRRLEAWLSEAERAYVPRVTTKSYWSNLDERGRKSALNKALGLA